MLDQCIDRVYTISTSTKAVKSRVGESVESALSALAAIFSALSVYFNNFRQKRVLIVLQQNNVKVC